MSLFVRQDALIGATKLLPEGEAALTAVAVRTTLAAGRYVGSLRAAADAVAEDEAATVAITT